MKWDKRPEIPEWPGYGCGQSKEQFEAPYRGAQGAHDREVRRQLNAAKQRVAQMAQEPLTAVAAVEMRELKHLINGLQRGKLPRKPKAKKLKSGAPLVAPGGRTQAPLIPGGTGWWRDGN